MTRRDLVWASAFALAARNAPLARFAEVPIKGGGFRIESTPLTPAEVYAHCAHEADFAAAMIDAGSEST